MTLFLFTFVAFIGFAVAVFGGVQVIAEEPGRAPLGCLSVVVGPAILVIGLIGIFGGA